MTAGPSKRGAARSVDVDVTDIEITLAAYLAEAWAREPEVLRIIEDVMHLHVDDDAIEVYEEGLIELALDRIAERERALNRPRSPIELMVDRACGIVH